MLADTITKKQVVSSAIKVDAELKLLTNMSELLSDFASVTQKLEENLDNAKNHRHDPLELAKYYRDSVLSVMNELREIGDSMEEDMASDYWPYPSYGDMLYSVQ